MRRPRYLVRLLLLAVVGLLAVGCSSPPPSSETPGKEAAPTNVNRSRSK